MEASVIMDDSKRKLTQKQQKFVDLYEGNATEAAKLAGYRGDNQTLRSVGRENLTKPHIWDAIQNRDKWQADPLMTERDARRKWLVDIVRDTTKDIKDRMKAMEMLQRTYGDFLTVHQLRDETGNDVAFPQVAFILSEVPEHLKKGSIT